MQPFPKGQSLRCSRPYGFVIAEHGRQGVVELGSTVQFLGQIVQYAPQGAEVIERQVRLRRQMKSLAQLAEELRLLDAVDSQVRFQIGVQVDDLRRVARLLDHEVHQKLRKVDSVGRGRPVVRTGRRWV